MKKTIRSSLLCFVLVLLAGEILAQVTAHAQQQKSDSERRDVKDRKLKDVLSEIKDHYNVDILFFDRYVDYTVPADVIRWDRTIEKNLEEILKTTNLEFKKTKKGGFVISPKKISQVEVEPEQSKNQQQQTSLTAGLTTMQDQTILPPGTITVKGTIHDEDRKST